MNLNQQEFENRKNQILKTLAQLLIDNYTNGGISYFEMKKAAGYILDHIEEIKNEEDLFLFLENLSFYWEIFRHVLILEKERNSKNQEEAVIKKLSQYIKSSI